MAEESEEVKKELKRLNFPMVEGDMAPSVVIPKACQALQKHLAKIDPVLQLFLTAPTLTSLQQKQLDFETCMFLLKLGEVSGFCFGNACST